MTVLIKIIQVIFALSLLILIHECGHFLFAKLFKTRVPCFYLFFNPKFSIFKCKKINGKWKFKFFSKNLPDYDDNKQPIDINTLPEDDWRRYPENTEYGIGWIPLGGYCAIAGMIDESMNVEAMKLPPQPWEFRTKPAWQRFLIMFGGVLFNFILAFILYASILHTWGAEYLSNEDAVYGIAVNDLSYEMGFRYGDKIKAFDGVPNEDFSQLQIEMLRAKADEATVIRGNDTISVAIDHSYFPEALNTPGMFDIAYPFIVSGFVEGSPNVESGLMAGDKVTAVDGKPMFIVQEIQKELANYKDTTICLSVERNGETLSIPVSLDTAGRIGVMLESDLTKMFHVTELHYSFFSAIPAGISRGFKQISDYVKELGLIFSPKTEAYKSVGSFISIGRIFPGTWDWYRVWSLAAMLSVMLGVLNLVPIPGLDGGHILFLLVEIITRKKPSDKFLEVAQTIGMILILALMVLAFGNDIKSLFQ